MQRQERDHCFASGDAHGREIINFTYNEVARGTGYSPSYLSRVFRGLRNPSKKCSEALADFLGISVDNLFAILESPYDKRQRNATSASR